MNSTAGHPAPIQLPSGNTGPAPIAKWAALINDRHFPMPRRKLSVDVLLAQCGASPGQRLVRDLVSPIDMAFSPDASVDLAEGNVFRLVDECPHHALGATGAAPKLAFFLDDAWEVTAIDTQNDTSIRGLFALGAEVELFRDFESPDDEPIGAGVAVLFRDGPVLRTSGREVGVAVTTRILNAAEPPHRFRVLGPSPLLTVMQTGARMAGVRLLPDAASPLDRLHNLRGPHVGDAIDDLDEPLQSFLRRPGVTHDFGIELVLAIRVNTLWAIAPTNSMTPRQILALFALDPADFSLYLGRNPNPLPPDTAIAVCRGEVFEAQKDGKYGEGR